MNAAQRAAILSGAAGAAAVRSALISRPVRKQLRSALGQMIQPGWRVGPLQITRAKYRPGKKIAAFYTFPTAEQANGGHRNLPLAVTWAAGADSNGSGSKKEALAALQEEARERGLLTPFRQLWGEIPEWGIHLQLWPLDEEFPQLARLGDPRHMPDLYASANLPPPNPGGSTRITPIRYRPGERHVLLYRDHLPGASGGSSRRLYAKIYRTPEAAARAFRVACRVVDWLEDNVHGFRGVRPAGWSAEEGVIFYPHAPGLAISGQLGRGPEWLAGHLHRTGSALCALHSGPPELSQELEADTFADELRVVNRATEYVRVLLPETEEPISRLLQRVEELNASLPQEPPTFTHSDFKADHLLASRDQLTLIDFDTCALADPALDVGKFLADLEWWFGLTGTPGVEQAQQAFLNGYAWGDNAGRLSRARLYQALILLKITARRARLFAENWAPLTKQMIQRAESALD